VELGLIQCITFPGTHYLQVIHIIFNFNSRNMSILLL